MSNLNFLLIGAAGYIAPRHLKAIKETGNNLLAAVDVSDSVGILDSYFPEANFFTSFEEFSEFSEGALLDGLSIDFVTICSPNHLHVTHIKWALARGLNVICEKPLVLKSTDLDELQRYENKYGASVFSILQLRLHDSILKLKESISEASKADKKLQVELTYITSRGKWYGKSWKGDIKKSGGVVFNIGIHFFDMLSFIFGEPVSLKVAERSEQTVRGELTFTNADVEWFLSIDSANLPPDAVYGEKATYRKIVVGDLELEFSTGFTDLHTKSYEEIIAGRGFSLCQNKSAIQIAQKISGQE